MNQQQQPSPIQGAARLLDFLVTCAFVFVFPLRLFSRVPGTVGARIWIPDLLLSFFVMMVFIELFTGYPSIMAWWFSNVCFWAWVFHVGAYLHRHRKGKGVSPHYLGDPWFGTTFQCDTAFALLFALAALLMGDEGFLSWSLACIPFSFISCQIIHQRDLARERQIVGSLAAQRYYQKMAERASRQFEEDE